MNVKAAKILGSHAYLLGDVVSCLCAKAKQGHHNKGESALILAPSEKNE